MCIETNYFSTSHLVKFNVPFQHKYGEIRHDISMTNNFYAVPAEPQHESTNILHPVPPSRRRACYFSSAIPIYWVHNTISTL